MTDKIPRLGAELARIWLTVYLLATIVPRVLRLMPANPSWHDQAYDGLVEAGVIK